MSGGPNARPMNTLFNDLRSDSNLFSAWRHVKRSALNSSNNEIRGCAAEFEHQHHRHIRRIQRQLRERKFKFDPVTGVLKDKKKRIAQGKEPRPIAVASIKNRVVQRALLQILQPRIPLNDKDLDTKYKAKYDPRLDGLNDVARSKYGVGGLMRPYGGVRPAIGLIMDEMAKGVKYYYQSDIKGFFTKIPTQQVVEIVRSETGDDDLSALFSEALKVELSNKDELLTYARLFPSNDIGVAQGSSLSAFAGNVLLYDFDHQLNEMGVLAIRYIDDIIILSKSLEELEVAIEYSERYLSSLDFQLYPPVAGSSKASRGQCKDAFRFLGCTLQPNRCVPSRQSVEKLLRDIDGDISASKASIKSYVKCDKDFHMDWSRSAVIRKVGRRIYGWRKSFSFCNDWRSLAYLDNDIDKKIGSYEGFVLRMRRKCSKAQYMRIIGIPNVSEVAARETNDNSSEHVRKTIITADT